MQTFKLIRLKVSEKCVGQKKCDADYADDAKTTKVIPLCRHTLCVQATQKTSAKMGDSCEVVLNKLPLDPTVKIIAEI